MIAHLLRYQGFAVGNYRLTLDAPAVRDHTSDLSVKGVRLVYGLSSTFAQLRSKLILKFGPENDLAAIWSVGRGIFFRCGRETSGQLCLTIRKYG